jgi:hypothetical protein
VLALIDSVIAGWNETCQKDPDSGEYCNSGCRRFLCVRSLVLCCVSRPLLTLLSFLAIIDAFEDVDELDDMPQDEVCSYCFGGKLRMMQASPYSGYDELYQEQLLYVNEGKSA